MVIVFDIVFDLVCGYAILPADIVVLVGYDAHEATQEVTTGLTRANIRHGYIGGYARSLIGRITRERAYMSEISHRVDRLPGVKIPCFCIHALLSLHRLSGLLACFLYLEAAASTHHVLRSERI